MRGGFKPKRAINKSKKPKAIPPKKAFSGAEIEESSTSFAVNSATQVSEVVPTQAEVTEMQHSHDEIARLYCMLPVDHPVREVTGRLLEGLIGLDQAMLAMISSPPSDGEMVLTMRNSLDAFERTFHEMQGVHADMQAGPSFEVPDSSFCVELDTQTKRLHDKLLQIAGPAKLLLLETPDITKKYGNLKGSTATTVKVINVNLPPPSIFHPKMK